ncbi:MAG: Mut7-C RNAse domain-containing protein [Terriglobales bacterium]
MRQAIFRFYAELNDFLPPERRMKPFPHDFALPASVKDIIESLGAPHTEVDLILANGAPVGFTYLVQHGDRISIYPALTAFDVGSLGRLRPPLDHFRFVLDTHLGRLAAYLRMLGFDALYENVCDDNQLAQTSARENRILLTRDRGLLKRGSVTYGYFVRATEPRRQLVEVLQRFSLFSAVAPFQRCLRCNALLQTASKESISHLLPTRTGQYYSDFRFCDSCNRVYWAGSHHQHMQRFIERVLAAGRVHRETPR